MVKLEQLIKIIVPTLMAIIVSLFLLIPNQKIGSTQVLGKHSNTQELPCLNLQTKLHRKNNRKKFIACLIEFNDIKLNNELKTNITSKVNYKNQSLWVIEQLVSDETCYALTKYWDIDKTSMKLINEYELTRVC